LLVLKAIVMGLIQGLTEFLPVSSTAHLLLAPWLFGWQGLVENKAFDISLHLGTLIALLVYFRKDLVEVFRARDRRLVALVVAGCLPAAPLYFVEKGVEKYSTPAEFAGAPLVIAAFLIVFAFVLRIADRTGAEKTPMDRMTLLDAFIVGIGQTVAAAFPGASRSGTTMSFALFRGLTREAAVRFSFLLSIPTIAAVVIFSAAKHHSALTQTPDAVVAGVVSSAVSGYVAVAFLLNYVRKHSMDVFFWYRLALGAFILAVFFAR
jgi:undecaprenyl-diphosphatase